MDPPGEGKSMDKTDARVQDPLVLDEIELYGDLVIAASSSDKPLSQTRDRPRSGPGPGAVREVLTPARAGFGSSPCGA